MSSDSMASSARQRIFRFSLALSVIGLLVIAGIGYSVLTADDVADATSEDYYYPWENPRATAATADGDVWSGRGQQFIPLTGLTPGEPLEFSPEGDAEFSGVYLGPADAVDERPIDVGYSRSSTLLLVPTAPEMTIWVRMRTAADWTVTVRPAQIEERTGTVSGIGPMTFRYTGDATAARMDARGGHPPRVNIITANGTKAERSESGQMAWTLAWSDTPTAVFQIDAYDDVSWTLEFLAPAGGVDE
ncbi:hypothetical protein [Microbacterium esteraromaticum]|nr:hypothetical protein [Microbacterium esteraromaticum]